VAATYPATDLIDRPPALAACAGSFWADAYAGAGAVRRYALGLGGGGGAPAPPPETLAHYAAQADAAQAPPLRPARLVCLALRPDAKEPALPAYGDDADPLGDGLAYGALGRYGVSLRPDWHAWPLPDGLVDAALALSRLTLPGRPGGNKAAAPAAAPACWVRGVDFRVDAGRGQIVFRSDPAADDRFLTLRDPGTGAAKATIVWLAGARYDRADVARRHGAAAGLPAAPASPAAQEAYRDLAAARLEAQALGPSRSAFWKGLGAVTGARLAARAATVERVESTPDGLVVVTDEGVYRYHRGARPLVAAGASVAAGAALADTARVWELGRVNATASGADLPGGLERVVLTAGLLRGTPGVWAETFTGPLAFYNRDEPLAVEADGEGRTTARFGVQGAAADVALFWALAHERGVALGKTLAHWLDRRGDGAVAAGAAEPTAANLPASLNPAAFVAAHVARGLVQVQVRTEHLTDAALGLDWLDYLAPLTPLGAAVSYDLV
jgi:hypothetical protein